jgi:hypothetical protein
MARCPKGHESAATDYCDECGALIGGQQVISVSAPPATSGSAPATQECPKCGNPRAGRFCEVCGHDFVLGGDEPAASAGDDPTLVPTSTGTGTGTGSQLPRRVGAPPGWRVVAAADPEYHARMQAVAMPDAPAVPFPAFCPERRFPLRTTQQLIGRRRPSRGIEPDIDLTGPPEDPAVSHSHALLVPGPNGGWSVVDLESANGTYLNGSADPIEPNVPVPLGEGDRIHVGAWTTLTIQREETA